MEGTEYMLLHVQEPILYVIRKLHRQSPTKGTHMPAELGVTLVVPHETSMGCDYHPMQ